MAENPRITFQAVLHNFVLTALYRFASSGSCLEIGLRTPTFPAQAPGLRESASAKAVEARHEAWKARLPKGESDLWDALTAFDRDAQASLFAHCASFAANAIYEPANRYDQGRVWVNKRPIVRAIDRPPEEGSRASSRWFGLVAGAAAPRRPRCGVSGAGE